MTVRELAAHYPRLRESATVRPVVEFSSWLGGDYLGVVPALEDWAITDKETDAVRGELSFAVPRLPEWEPTGWDHPLGNNGQIIRARVGLRSAVDEPIVWADLGHYRIESATPGDDQIDVIAVGPAKIIEDARFTVDPLIMPGATHHARAAWIVQALVPLSMGPGLVDRTIAAETVSGRDRLKALTDVLESWPAVMEPEGAGLIIRAPYESEGNAPELTWSDGEGGTLVEAAPATGDDDRIPNAMVVSNDTGTLQAIAAVDVGPMRYGGPYGYRPEFYASPLFTSVQQCLDTARTRLARAQRRTGRITATAVTDLRVTVGTRIRIVSTATRTDVVARVAEVKHKWATTEIAAAVLSGRVNGSLVETPGISSTAGLTPVADLGAGRISIPVGDTGTWSDRRGAWRTDTTDLVVGRNEHDSTAGFCWWGRTPQGLPGTLVAGSVDLVRADNGTESVTVTPQLIAGINRVGTGKPVVLSTANQTISLSAVENGERKAVSWDIPTDWLALLDSGAAGGLGFIAIEQDPVTIASSGQSLTLRLDWRR